tara:strand:+ start:6294 stop:6407 length:114 start_codon:yes stop_codon:yes gene_type:complete
MKFDGFLQFSYQIAEKTFQLDRMWVFVFKRFDKNMPN